MAIIKSCVKLIIKNQNTYHYSGKVLSLGVPEIYATQTELQNWFPVLAKKEFPLSPADIKITAHELGRKLKWVSADNFLRSLGYSEIFTLDIPGSEHAPDIVHDLNQPIPDLLIGNFDLVLDPGTTEHVFDIKTALTNIVHSLRIGGIVIHQVPVYSFNGGYYSINPNVLNDFYRTNGFGEIKTYIIMWDRYRAYFGKHRCYEYSEDVLGRRHALADYDQCRYSPQMLFFARKIEETRTIHIPVQFEGDYMGGLAPGTSSQTRETFSHAAITSAKSLINHLFSPSISLFLFAMVRRWTFLLQSRKHSYWI